jgi:hypothetical protein
VSASNALRKVPSQFVYSVDIVDHTPPALLITNCEEHEANYSGVVSVGVRDRGQRAKP